jgi:hypothetical protein
MSNVGQSRAEIQAEMDQQWFEEHHKAPEAMAAQELKARLEAMGYESVHVHVHVRGVSYHVLALDDRSDILTRLLHAIDAEDFLRRLPDLTKPPTLGLTPEQWAKVPCAYSW